MTKDPVVSELESIIRELEDVEGKLPSTVPTQTNKLSEQIDRLTSLVQEMQ